MHLGPERVVAAKLRRVLCGANTSCAALGHVLAADQPTQKPRTWGAGDPNYVKDMIARGKAKKTNKVIP